MADQPTTEQFDDLANPYQAPARDLGHQWGAGDPGLEAIRRANLADEAYLKYLVRANFLYAAFFCAIGGYVWRFPITHALGQIEAPWVAKPNWIALFYMLVIMAILAILGGVGLLRRKAWAIFVDTLLVMSVVIVWVLPLLNREEPTPIVHFVLWAFFGMALATPFLNVWDLRKSAVFGNDYVNVVEATSHIEVKAKLPLSLRLMLGAFAAVFAGLAAYLALAW